MCDAEIEKLTPRRMCDVLVLAIPTCARGNSYKFYVCHNKTEEVRTTKH